MAKRSISSFGIELICSFEGFSSKAYLDVVGVPTIGYGTTIYPTGVKVTMYDNPVTKEQAREYIAHHVKQYIEPSLNNLVLNQNQFDSLCSFCYNEGLGNFKSSTLLKKVMANPNDEEIKEEFKKWIYADHKPLAGLIERRKKESEIYFQPC